MTLSTLRRRYWREGFGHGFLVGVAVTLVTVALAFDFMGG